MIAEKPGLDAADWESSAVDGSFERILAGARTLLLQGEYLLTGITPEQYSTRVTLALGGSIGTHYRHCLDHFINLLGAGNGALVDFDRRDRDPLIETEPDRALTSTRQIRSSLARWEPEDLARIVGTRCEISHAPGASPRKRGC